MRRWASMAACGLVLTVGAQLAGVETASARSPDRDGGPVSVMGQSSANGAALLAAEPGWYTSKAPGADETVHYQVERSMPRSDLTAGIIIRPPEPMDYAMVRVELSTVGGTVCDSDNTWKASTLEPTLLMDASVSDAAGGKNAKTAKRCDRADRFVLTVWQTWDDGNDALAGTRMDIGVNEEPRVTNRSDLPEPGDPPDWVPPSSTQRVETEGATHPLRAEPLRPGSYRTTIESGEQLFFRIDLDWGQAMQAHVRVPRPPKAARAAIDAGGGYQKLVGQALGPTFGDPRATENVEEDTNKAVLSSASSSELQVFTNRVRFRGRTVDEPRASRKSSAAGPYYLVVTLSESSEKYELPISLELNTRGESETAPAYADRATPIGPGLGDVTIAEDSTALWLLGGGSLLFVAGAGTLTVSSIRKRSGPDRSSQPLPG